MNPLALVPLKAREYVYPALGLLALIWSAYEASNGNIAEAIGAVVIALGNGVAASNTPGDTETDRVVQESRIRR